MNENYKLLNSTPSTRTPTCKLFLLVLLIITAACRIPAAVALGIGRTKIVREACGLTRYPDLCLTSLANFRGVGAARNPMEVAHISMNVTLRSLGAALSVTTEFRNVKMDTLTRSAYEDCLELMESSVDLLARSMFVVSKISTTSSSNGGNMVQGGSNQDVMTWLSGAMTNQDTCIEGFSNVGGTIKNQMVQRVQHLSKLVTNCLAIYATTSHKIASNLATHNRRLLGFEHEIDPKRTGFPKWMSRSERELLGTPTQSIQANIVVAQDGSGNVKTITEAIKKAPENSTRRFIIIVKAGMYEEDNLKVGLRKTNLWFLGEGKGQTIISGKKSVGHDLITTFHTASFAATGSGFVARDITFVNEAGPNSNQAVALRVGADHAVVYRCEIKGYQDTLYVHSNRQFYRECDIYGTVDYIFGNAAVVFQNCTMWARKPQVSQQKLTITAQKRYDPNQNTGMSIQACQARATMDLEVAKSNYPTYLGRPWKLFARVVFMESYLGDHIDPVGWLEWNATSPIDNVYYGEYSNFGPRASTSQRVKWPSLHVNMSRADAVKFTVAQFITGQGWITATGVSYQSGLST